MPDKTKNETPEHPVDPSPRSLTVEDVSEPDDVATGVVEFWTKMEQERQRLVEKWDEVRSYVFATDTTATTANTSPWKNKTTRPKLTWIHDKLLSEYIRNLIPSDNFFRWMGSPRSNKMKAKAVEHLMTHKLRHPLVQFRKTMAQCLDDFILFGNAFAGVEYVTITTKKISDGSTEIAFKGARPYRISPMDSAIEPTANSFQDSYFAHGVFKRYEKFFQEIDKNPGLYIKESVEKIKAAISRNYGEGVLDYIKEKALKIDGVDFQDAWASGNMHLIEYYGDIYDRKQGRFLPNQHVVVANKTWAIVIRPNDSYTGDKPVVHASWRKRPDNLWGMGPLENIIGLQYRIDHLENAKSDALDYCVYPIRKVTGDSTDLSYPLVPGAEWYVPAQGDVELIYPDPRVLMFESPINAYEREMEEYAGVPRETAGFRTPGEKTAFEVDQLLSHADQHFAEKLLQFESEFIEPLLNLLLELTVRNLTDYEMKSIPEEDMEGWSTLSPSDLKQDGRLYPIGSKHFKHRETRLQKLQQLFTLGAQMAPSHIKPYNALKTIEEESSLEDYGLVSFGGGLEEQAELQQKQKEIQDEMSRKDPNAQLAQPAPPQGQAAG